jgi:opacity protein-like surface antigen
MLKLAQTKKLIFATVVLFTINLSCLFAQTHKFEIGFGAGPNISFVNESFGKMKAKFGFNAGISFQYNINKFLSLEVNPSFAQQNYKLFRNINCGYYDINEHLYYIWTQVNTDYKCNYALLPVVLKLVLPFKRFSLFSGIGPYFGYLISKSSSTETIPYTEFPNQNSNSFKSIDMGISYVLGTSIKITDHIDASIAAKGNFGLYQATNEYRENRSVSLQVGINYKFKENKEANLSVVKAKKKKEIRSYSKGFEIGIEAGGTAIYILNYQNEDDISKVSEYFGFIAGFNLQYNFNKNLALRTGLSFEQKSYSYQWAYSMGNSNSGIGSGAGPTRTFNGSAYITDYHLTIPLLLRAGLNYKIANFYIIAGPYCGSLIASNRESTANWGKSSSTDIKGAFDAGISVGLGTTLILNKNIGITIEPRYNLDFIDNIKIGNGEYQSTTFALVVGLSYKFGEKKAK